MTVKDVLQVVVEQKALHYQDVDLLIGLVHVRGRRQSDAVGASELYRVLDPASYRVGHGLHVQSCDHCGQQVREIMETTKRSEKTKNESCNLLGKCLLFESYCK